jgi:CheY-like chemotaxis protein
MTDSNGQPTTGGPGGQQIVFLVDDEPLILELSSAILRPLGFKIAAFRDPRSALEVFRTTEPPPVLIITDFAMPGMDGLQLLEHCRRIRPGQKVLMLSGTVEESFFEAAAEKPDAFLSKPFQPGQLLRLVRSLLK